MKLFIKIYLLIFTALANANCWFFPKNGGIHFYHNVQAFNVDSRSTLKA